MYSICDVFKIGSRYECFKKGLDMNDPRKGLGKNVPRKGLGMKVNYQGVWLLVLFSFFLSFVVVVALLLTFFSVINYIG